MRSIRDLAALNFFDPEKIEPDIKPDQENGTVDINYKLEPKPSDQVQISFGWGPTGISGNCGIEVYELLHAESFQQQEPSRSLPPR